MARFNNDFSIQQLSEQQRQQEALTRIQEGKDAEAYIRRTAVEKGWPQEDLDEVLCSLGLVSAPTNLKKQRR